MLFNGVMVFLWGTVLVSVASMHAAIAASSTSRSPLPLCGQVVFMSGNTPLPRRDDWVEHTRILLNDGTDQRAVPGASGSFCFHGLDHTVGYTLTVMSNEYVFPTMYVECDQSSLLWSAHNFNQLEGPTGGRGGVTPIFKPIERIEAFDQEQKMNPMGILKNPMVIMAIISMGMMFIMPMLTEGLTEEEKKEMAMQNPMNAEGGLMGMLQSAMSPNPPAKTKKE